MDQVAVSWQATVAENLLAARRKNGRLGSRKSRGGCLTCKARRVKCDEVHPACRRCASTGRKCEGYAEAVGNASNHGRLPVGMPLSQFLNLRQSDKRAFDFFLSWTAPRLAGGLDKEFWCGHVLQLAQAEPLVLDSVIAISVLYEHPQYLTSFRRGEKFKQPVGGGAKADEFQDADQSHATYLDEHHAEALKSYNRAIAAFAKQMANGKATPLLALLSCALFICIEVIRDNIPAALGLLTKGNDLLKQFGNVHFEGQEQQLLSIIKLMFARIGVLAAAVGHPHPVNVPPEFVVIGQHRVFANLADARTSLYSMMADSHDYIREAAVYKEGLLGERDGSPWKTNFLFDDFRSHAGKSHDTLRAKQDAMSETSAAVLPATFNVRTGEGMTEAEDEAYNVRVAAAQVRPWSHAGRTRIFKKDDDMFDLLKEQCDCEDPVCCSGRHGGAERADLYDRSQELGEKFSVYELGTHALTEPDKELEGPQFGSVTELLEKQLQFELRLGQWYDAFQWAKSPPSHAESATSSSLLLYYHVSFVWLTTRLAPHQTVFDEYTFHFEQILRHAEVYVNATALQRPVFTFEVGAVPPLYFAIAKCRIPTIRRKALQLLAKAPRKECMWGATSTGQLAARIVAIEEEGLGLPEPAWDGTCDPVTDAIVPPESSRLHNLEILKDKATGAFQVRVKRYREEDGRVVRYTQDYPI